MAGTDFSSAYVPFCFSRSYLLLCLLKHQHLATIGRTEAMRGSRSFASPSKFIKRIMADVEEMLEQWHRPTAVAAAKAILASTALIVDRAGRKKELSTRKTFISFV